MKRNEQEKVATVRSPQTDTITDTITIERCPHDRENPYTMVHNDLIRDASISPECRWLIIYLLSNKPGWRINVTQIVNHLKGTTGRDRVYQIINEAIEAGYMKRETLIKGNLKQQVKYFVSETPKFKKCFRHPGFQDTELRDTENQDDKEEKEKEGLSERNNFSLKVPLPDDSAKAESAKASEVENLIPSKSKRLRTPSDFSPKIREVGQQLINSLIRTKEDYVPPKNLSAFLTEVDFLLRLDKRDPQKVYDVFNWALADSFWCDKMFKPNPAKYLREKFDQLEMKMNAKPPQPPKKERKFAPCSNDEKARAIINKMLEEAL